MQRIKKGDTVQVITGNEIGARGEVEKVLVDWYVDRDNRRLRRNPEGDKLVIRGVNIRKKHQRPISQTRTQTGIIERESPVHISNVMLVCPNCDEASRIGFRIEGDKKVRVCKRCGSPIDKVS
ncbi:MAG: 50S ribosomal protein L24 [Anaerolineae bacterium]|nr:50S ribosomal protein L24 [Anaerolineae bacterium]GIK38271.1 MAG: 50S ribosomal protein L24 [Chloroflexota bacterium]